MPPTASTDHSPEPRPGRRPPAIDLGALILSPFPAAISPDQERCRHHSLRWLERVGVIRDERGRRHADAIRVDMLTARVVPHLRGEPLDLYNDWMLWGVVLDDWLDCDDPGAIRAAVAELTGILYHDDPERLTAEANPYVRALADLWRRQQRTPLPWRHHLADTLIGWLENYLTEAAWRRDGLYPSLPRYLEARVHAIAMPTYLALGELLQGLMPSERVNTCGGMRELRRCLIDYTIWMNDLISFEREHHHGDHINAVLILRKLHGRSPEEAVAEVAVRANDAVRSFLRLEPTLPRLMDDLDADEDDRRQATAVAAGLRSWFRGNLDWYVHDTGRYRLSKDMPGLPRPHAPTGEDG